jgi:quercetin dioxygenase-like cupin family protein
MSHPNVTRKKDLHMQIVRKDNATFLAKPNGTNVWYYLFQEYEIHYNEIAPGTVQEWHCHDIIEEMIYAISGQLQAEWIEDGKRYKQILSQGDLIRSENSIHTFTNPTESTTTFFALKLVLDGKDKSRTFQTDKRVFPSALYQIE